MVEDIDEQKRYEETLREVKEEARETAEEFGPQAKDAGLDLTTNTPEAPVWARADEGGLHIAIRNLLSNAIKYTEPGGQV